MEEDGRQPLPSQPDGRLREISSLVTSVEEKLETVKKVAQEAQEELARIKNLLEGLTNDDMPRKPESGRKPLPDFPNNFPDDPDEPRNPERPKDPFWDRADSSY